MTDFHRIYINNYELYSDWIIANHYVNSSPLHLKQYRFVSEETKQKPHVFGQAGIQLDSLPILSRLRHSCSRLRYKTKALAPTPAS